MAETKTLTLKATLDTTEVKQELQQLNSGGVAGTASGINDLANSLKGLKSAIGGGALVGGITDLMKTTQAFGENTNEVVQTIRSSATQLFAAFQTGNPYIIGASVAIVALNAALKNMTTAAQKAQQDIDDWNKRMLGNEQGRQAYKDYQENSRFNQLINGGGTQAQLELEREAIAKRRSELVAQMDAAMKNPLATITKEQISELEDYDKKLQQINTAIENIVQTEETRRKSDLKQFMEGKVFDAKKWVSDNSFTAFLEQQKNRLKEIEANHETDSNRNAKLFDEENRIRSLLGHPGALGNFSAAGFSMGEMNITTTISRQIDEIIRLMRDQTMQQIEIINPTL